MPFNTALKAYVMLSDAGKGDTQEGRVAQMRLFSLAPKWVRDGVIAMGYKLGIIPLASGYLDDGSPMFTFEALARHHGLSVEEAEAVLTELKSDRAAAGLPEDDRPFDGQTFHGIQ